MSDHIKPAAKKPLYKPRFATSTFVSSANSLFFYPKAIIPLCVIHKNISKITMYMN